MASPKRDMLLDCARKLFETEGFHTTGIDRILETAGVAKMTLYNNFGSKDLLIVAVLEKASYEMIRRLEEATSQVSSDPYEQILGIFDALALWHSDPEFCGCMFQAAVAEFPDHDSEPAKAAAAHFQRVATMFEQMCSKAELPDPQTLSSMLGMLASGASCSARQTRTRQPADHARQIAEILLERACSSGFSPIEPTQI
jgi:AcrR family transcriptional regulator